MDASTARQPCAAIAKGQYVEHRVFFAKEEVAIAAGYRPCGSWLRAKYRKRLADNQSRKVIRDTELSCIDG